MASFFHHSDSKAGGRFLSTHSGLMQFNQVQGFPTHMCNNTSLPRLSNPGSCVVRLEQGTTDSQRCLTWTDLTESGQSSSSTSGRQSCPARGPINLEGYRVFCALQAFTQAVHPQHPWGPFSIIVTPKQAGFFLSTVFDLSSWALQPF